MEMRYKFSSKQYEEIKAVRKTTRDKQTDKRLKVLELHCEGKGLKEIAEATGFHCSHVSGLIRQYFEEGLEAISKKHYTGNRRNMSFEEETAFLEQYQRRAEEGQLLDTREIAKAYEEKVGHSIGGSQIYLVLRRHGWRKVMPKSRHPKKASEEAVEASKNLTVKSKS